MLAHKHCELLLPTNRSAINSVDNSPGRFVGFYETNWVSTTHSAQWLSWVFTTQERKKERKSGFVWTNNFGFGFGWLRDHIANPPWKLRMIEWCAVMGWQWSSESRRDGTLAIDLKWSKPFQRPWLASGGCAEGFIWFMDLLLGSALPISVNWNVYETAIATDVEFVGFHVLPHRHRHT